MGKKTVLPSHVQRSSKKSQKRYIKYKTGSEKTKQKMLDKAGKRARSNFANLGRILQGPEGGQFTSSGRGKNKLGDKIVE